MKNENVNVNTEDVMNEENDTMRVEVEKTNVIKEFWRGLKPWQRVAAIAIPAMGLGGFGIYKIISGSASVSTSDVTDVVEAVAEAAVENGLDAVAG